MVMHNLDRITDALMRGGRDANTATAVIAGATTAQERILVSTLGEVADAVRKQRFEPDSGSIRISADGDRVSREYQPCRFLRRAQAYLLW